MKRLRVLIAGVALFLSSCTTIQPTPFLIDNLVEKNDKAVELYVACSDGANYIPEKEGCQPEELEKQLVDTMSFAKEFISADIKQPQGYDIYLAAAMVYFRIAERNGNEYSEAEKIARQFFEMQKASGGKSLNDARFYWAALCSAHASWQWFNDRLSIDADRKTDLLSCYAEGTIAFQETTYGPRKIRLLQYLQVIKAISEAI